MGSVVSQMNIKQNIKSLISLIQKETNEQIFISRGKNLINDLRDYWRSQKKEFSEKDVTLLKDMAIQLDAVEYFSELIEDLPYISDRDDAYEMVDSLNSITEKVKGLAIEKRIKKEIRELVGKMPGLPFRETQKRNTELSNAINQLDAEAPPCKKCGAKMVIRKTDKGYFWGCSNFPKCWCKAWLKKTELDLISE